MKIIKKLIIVLFLALIIGIGYLGFRIRENVQQVMTYKKLVNVAVKEHNITEYEDLVFSIIYTESKGRSVDLMQSSESAYGEQAMIDTPEESIETGVTFLAQAIAQSKEAGCDIWTAVQAYNFGLDYITFVKERGGKNSVKLAEEYSREVLSPLLGNENKKTYRYYRPQALLYNGGYLYNNGGNMFYAEIVKMNRQFIQWFG